jgi:hypothetical protein
MVKAGYLGETPPNHVLHATHLAERSPPSPIVLETQSREKGDSATSPDAVFPFAGPEGDQDRGVAPARWQGNPGCLDTSQGLTPFRQRIGTEEK